MIVLDASAVVEIVTNSPLAALLNFDLAANRGPLLAPHLLDIEVLSALRNLAIGQRLDSHRIQQSIDGLAALPIERYSHLPLTHRIWELRHNFTAYDAAYIALAEMTGSVLFTCDEKLRKGHRARVVVYPPYETQ